MSRHRLFVYGTLLEGSIQELVIGRRIAGEAAVLTGYRRTTTILGGGAYPILVEDSDAPAVEGQILDVTDDELARLDEYEGEGYRRVQVTVESGAECWVYTK